jgi:hypothetical protein
VSSITELIDKEVLLEELGKEAGNDEQKADS